jgi:predicted DNA-binding protein YlxM (UPF0122 family)
MYSSPERVHELSVLRDLYEALLPPRQREVIGMKLDEDLSLAEIAERLGISRQGCEDALKRAERALTTLEGKLGLHRRLLLEDRCVGEAVSVLSSMREGNWREARDVALRLLEQVRNGGET